MTSPARCALLVLINQVGYEPNAPKRVRAQRTSDSAGSGAFSVLRLTDHAVVYTGPLVRKGSLWDKWYWEGDFSSLRIAGDYEVIATIDAESATSYPFAIASRVLLDQTGLLAYQYFLTQRCGVAVSGWHGVCHADDGLRSDTLQHIDASGGWHDAGDYGKFPHGFAGDGLFGLLWLYTSCSAHYDTIDGDTNGIPDILDECLHQARWLTKMVEPGGHVLQQTRMRRGGSSFVRPELDTDNVSGTSDDRWIDPGTEVTPQEIVVCAALIRMHRVLSDRGLPTENFREKALAIWNHRVTLAVAEGGHNNLGNAAMHVFAGLDLYAATGQQDCYDRALQRVTELADSINANPALYDSIIYAEAPGYELGVMAWFARNYPSTAPAASARAAVAALMDHNISVLASDRVGLIRRDEGGTLQYFPSDPNWNAFFLGLNRLYLLTAWGAVEAHKTLNNPAYLAFALDQYNWVLGANYDRLCMVDGVGEFNPPTYHTRYYKIPGHEDGAQPGVVPNGYVRVYSSGLPHMDLSGAKPARYQSNEGWLINNAAYAMALSAMSAFDDAAEYVSDTIPPVMISGRSYSVSITMRNTSFIAWDSQNYLLGAVDDSDPFATGRQMIAPGVTVQPGQEYTWTFNMAAPVETGACTTDWRMVQEDVNWFGGTLTMQVQVILPPLRGDFDADGDVDQADFGHLQFCLSGTAIPYGPGCGDADLDRDISVDAADFDLLRACMSGADRRPPVACEE